MGTGFLGLINRITAQELLKKPGDLLIRFSRTCPNALAFSFNYNGEMRHHINTAQGEENCIPIGKYLEDLQKQYKPLISLQEKQSV